MVVMATSRFLLARQGYHNIATIVTHRFDSKTVRLPQQHSIQEIVCIGTSRRLLGVLLLPLPAPPPGLFLNLWGFLETLGKNTRTSWIRHCFLCVDFSYLSAHLLMKHSDFKEYKISETYVISFHGNERLNH